MNLRRLASRVVGWWLSYRVERRCPELVALRKAEAERRRKHRPVKDIHQSRRAIVHAALASERTAR